MKEKGLVEDLLVRIEMVDTEGIERTRTADDAVNDISFGKQELGEIASILAGDSGDKGDFGHVSVIEFSGTK